MTTHYITVEIGTQSCARDRVFNGCGLARVYNGRWLGRQDNGRWIGRRDNGHINSDRRLCVRLLIVGYWSGGLFIGGRRATF